MSENHNHRQTGKKALKRTLVLTAVIMVAEFAGGWISGSLALLSDAGHMLTDVMAVGLSLIALRLAEMPANERKTYGFYRIEILAALANGGTLVLLAGFIFYEAVKRFGSPVPINSAVMIIVALVGLAANVFGYFTLKSSGGHNLNVRGAFLHIVGDMLSSFAVLAGGVVIYFTGFFVLDPLLSMLISIIILKGAYDVIKEAVDILLEGLPQGVEHQDVSDAIKAIPGIKDVHHMHVWSISSGMHALSAHVLIEDQPTSRNALLLEEINKTLIDKFNIDHTTIQFECASCDGTSCFLRTGKEPDTGGQQH